MRHKREYTLFVDESGQLEKMRAKERVSELPSSQICGILI